jgi:glycosyltransferase involved in cell wall biosynthesis
MSNFTVVMASYKRPLLLERGLRGIRKYWRGDIIVVDDNEEGPCDGTWEVCKARDARYVYLGSKNISLALNTGMSLVKTDWILLTCPEILWMNDIGKVYEKMIVESPHGLHSLVTPEWLGWEQWDRSVDWMSDSCLMPFCLMVNKELVHKAGWYDPAFGDGYAFEDNDFVDRLIDGGGKYTRVKVGIIHLYHGDQRLKSASWYRNKHLYEEKREHVAKSRCG